MTTKRKSQTTDSEPKNEPKKKRFDNKKKFSAAAGGKKFGKGKFPGKNFRGKDSKPAQPLEKPNWLEIKAKKKTQKIERKKEKFTEAVYEMGLRAKQIYEKLKSKRTVNKKDLAKELHETLCGKDAYTKLVLSHDIARVVQCLFKASDPDIRADIVDRLKDTIYQMSISKYAHFCVTHMLKYGSKHDREKIISGMTGNIVKMTTHRFSNTIIDLAYNQYASDEQKALMRQEFYSDLYKKQKDKRITKLTDTWTDSEVLKNGILQSTKTNILHAATKKLIDNSLLHAVMVEYLAVCSEESRTEIITAFAPILAALPSTKEGSATAVQCFLHAGNKERRVGSKSAAFVNC
jgi:pumilio homology domain family member 6